MFLIRKPNTLLLTKISIIVTAVVFLYKITPTPKAIPWLAKIVKYAQEEKVVRDVNFTFVSPSLVPQLPSREIFLLVPMSSVPGSDYQFARNAIRKTWGNSDECANTPDVSK